MVRRLMAAAVMAAMSALAQPPGIYSKPHAPQQSQPPQRAREAAMRHRGGGFGWGGGYGWWGPMWSSSFDYSPLPPPDRPKEMPVVVVNKEFTVERLNPVVREYGEGVLPAPKRESARAWAKRERCEVAYRSGVKEQGRECELVDDTLRYVNASGRRVTVGLELAEAR